VSRQGTVISRREEDRLMATTRGKGS